MGSVLMRASTAVAEQAESRRVFEHLATHDTLTGLANRVALRSHLHECIAEARAINVLFLDLDGFKLVNDSWGHAIGDELLVAVAGRLRAHLPPDVMLARTGGDEFVAVTPIRAQDVDGRVFADHVIAELSEPFSLSVGAVVITPSVGVTSSDGADSPDPETLVREADTAMYCAKEAGRACTVVYDEAMGQRVRQRVDLDRALRQALERDELSVVYQPIVHLQSDRVIGFEALVRWHRLEGPSYTPDVFIPAAEENGLIGPIGDFVMRHAIEQLARWRRETPHEVAVSINVSARQLLDGAFASRVLRELSARDLPPRALRLEITESTLVAADDQVAVQTLRDLEAAGVALSIDDFGTGYSSLSYLSRFRVHEVKVDRSFVSEITSRREDQAIVRATAAMANALGMSVVAEGIETAEQRDVVADAGIGYGQGWLFGRPMSPDAAAERVIRQWDPSTSAPPA
ncbi:MAG: putative bifunctional diguanylate cyclase/phosphodiesterase [Angustibacter sp.]